MCGRQAASSRLSESKLGKICFVTGALFVSVAAGASPSLAHTRVTAAASQPEEQLFGFSFWGQPEQQPVETRHRRTRQSAAPAMGFMGSQNSFSALSSGSSSVLNEASRWIGRGNVTGTHRAWCADFANFVLTRTGHRVSGSGMVNSMLSVGPRVSQPSPGDLVVMRSHVTIFAGYGGHGFYGLGGNQHHQVAMSNFPMRSVVAFVRPN
jgi:uncharacterized protein (TIGR02594 family)